MKRRIMIAATGLSAGTLIATAVINPKLVSDFMRIELVKADENGSNENINEWMPDPELQQIIAILLGSDVDGITQEKMMDITEAVVHLKDVDNIEGIQYLGGIDFLHFYNPVLNLVLVNKFKSMVRYEFHDMGISDFDVFSEMRGIGNKSAYFSAQKITLDEVTIENDKLVVDLSEYFRGDSFKRIVTGSVTFFAKINNRELEEDEFYNTEYPFIFTFDINELKSNSKFNYNKFKDTLVINFHQTVTINGKEERVPMQFYQPFIIPADDPKIFAKNVNLKVGDTWEDRYGLETAIDGKGDNIPIEDLYVDISNLDTSTPGTYKVVYYYEEGSDVYATSIVTVTNRSGSGTGAGNSSVKNIDTTNIMTDQSELDIYNLSGNKKGTKKLTEEITDFETNKVNTVNGVEYYNLGNDEWVRADDVKVFHFNDSYVQTHGSKYKNLTKFRNTGIVEDRGLEKSTDWYTDRYAFFQGEWHHRVATHEWIHDDHVVEYQNINGVVHANETATLYNSKGKKITDRALAKDSAFLTDKKATIDGKLMYRVATDEWVDADTVTFK
ncbi:SLAP domain-containing protein [Companilactobacillus muriivasis]|uniref:SLAP domain-containing protein n=1 Tax=Companilactobacillus muriivasis TaxID=3081444 RepID=UPI0030C714E0